MVDGIHLGIPSEVYHRDPEWEAISSSQLGHLYRSPAHWRAYRRIPPKATPSRQRAYDVGTALHLCVLEPERFADRVAARPPGHGARKDVKEAVATLKGEGYIVLSEADMEMVLEMAAAVAENATAAAAVAGGETEVSFLWTCPHTGVRCKGRADAWNRELGLVTDLKTCHDGRYEAFQRATYSHHYYIQAAFYLRGLAELGHEGQSFCIVAIEKERPYATSVYELDEQWLTVGETVIDSLIDLYAACEADDRWPAYGDRAESLAMMSWQSGDAERAVRRIDDFADSVRMGP